MAFTITPFVQKCVRVWKLLKKPRKEEFTTISKVSAIGIAIVGAIGFVIGVGMMILQVMLNIK